MKRKGIAAVTLTKETVKADPKVWSKVEKGEYRIAYASPEILLNKNGPFFAKTIRSKTIFSERLAVIAIDEAHTI